MLCFLHSSVFSTVGNFAKDAGAEVKKFFEKDFVNFFEKDVANFFGKRKKRSAGCGIGKVVPDIVDVPGINLDMLKEFAKRKLPLEEFNKLQSVSQI